MDSFLQDIGYCPNRCSFGNGPLAILSVQSYVRLKALAV